MTRKEQIEFVERACKANLTEEQQAALWAVVERTVRNACLIGIATGVIATLTYRWLFL